MTEQKHPALDNSSSRAMRVFEAACLAAAVGLIGVHAARFALSPEISWWAALLTTALALPAADFLSGLIHWSGDTWGKTTTPWIGPRFLVPFRHHHLYPQSMLGSSFVSISGDCALVSSLILGAALFLPLHSIGVVAVFVAATGAWGLPTSQIHKWAHDPRAPRVARWLQRAGLIMSPEHHRRHHRSPFAGHYCITTGWCNPLLERLRFWKALEWVTSRLTGLKPRGDVDVESTGGAARPTGLESYP